MRTGFRCILTGLFLAVMSGVSWGATISGAIFNNTSTSGRAYIGVFDTYGGNEARFGVSMPDPGPAGATYNVRGIPDGYYIVRAYLDTQNTGTRHANDPVAQSEMVSINQGVVSGSSDLHLSSPATTVAPVPAFKGVIPGPGSALVAYENPQTQDGAEMADSYTIYWHTADTVSKTVYTGKQTIPANGNDIFIQSRLDAATPLTDGTTLYYGITATVDGVEGDMTKYTDGQGNPIMVTIGAPAGGNTVSGTVTISGTTPTGPLYVLAFGNQGGNVTRIAAPVSGSNPFTINGVQNGGYQIFAVLDQNDDGVRNYGDLSSGDKDAPKVFVQDAAVAVGDLPLAYKGVSAGVSTIHRKGADGSEGYDLEFHVEGASRQPVNVALSSGTDVAGPVDLAAGMSDRINYTAQKVNRPKKPAEGSQSYSFSVTYADSPTPETVDVAITDVLDSFPQPDSPKGMVTFNPTPTFTWTPPVPAPDQTHSYGVGVWNSDNLHWYPDNLSVDTTSVQFNSDGNANPNQLSDNASYSWSIADTDRYGNQASIETTFFSGGSISGTVTGSDTNQGVPGVSISLYDGSGMFLSGYNNLRTGADGSFLIGGLAAGNYRVCFFPDQSSPYTAQCYDNKSNDSYNATSIPVTYQADTPLNPIILAAGATIHGTVTGSGSVPVQGVSVQLRGLDGNWVNGVNGAMTDASGNYTMQGVQPGSYKLFFDGSSAGYVGQWYNGASDLASAATITLAAAQNQVANASLVLGGSITGTVIEDVTNTPIQGIQVQIFDQSGNFLSNIQTPSTGSDGTYAVGGLTTGSYKVCFYGGSTNYVSECYDNVAYNQNNAPTVSVTAPNSTVANASLAKGGRITGRVTNGSNVGIQSVNVQLRDTNGNGVNVPGAFTDQNGDYSLGGIPVGSYKVYFDGSNAGGYVSKWYDGGSGTTNQGNAVTLAITAGNTQNGVGATLSQGASISGQVTDAGSHNGIAGINVRIYDGSGNPIPNNFGVSTDPAGSGNYSIGGLADGTYKVCFEGGTTGYVGKCYDNLAFDPANATPITISGGVSVTGKNAALQPGATISGRVTSGGFGVQNVWVEVRDTSGNWINLQGVNTDANGDYAISGIPAGSYKVNFYASGYPTQWYSGAGDQSTAQVITLAAGQTLTGINASFIQTGSISGTVTDSNNLPLSFIYVNVYDATSGSLVASSNTGGDGAYTIGGLPSGSYKLLFDGSVYGYSQVYYLNAATLLEGTALTVTAPAPTTAATVVLNRPYIKNGSNGYSSLQDAFNQAANLDVIQAQAQVFTISDLVFDRSGNSVTLKGGYDSSFASNTGNFSTISGKLTIRGGTLNVENVKIM